MFIFVSSMQRIEESLVLSHQSLANFGVIARNEARLKDIVGQAISVVDKRLPHPDDGSRSDERGRI
jgi:hypothetical protein